MGLATAFGGEGYRCKFCGYQSSLYSPNCPNCLKPSLVHIKKNPLSPNATQTIEVAEKKKPFGPITSFGMLLLLVSIIGGLYCYLLSKQPKTPAESPVVQPNPAAIRARAEMAKRISHPVHPALHAVRAHSSEAGASALPRHPMPMKLWQQTEDSNP